MWKLNKLTAYKCNECGHYTISRRDGMRCNECDSGALQPMGNATYIEKDNNPKRSKMLTIGIELEGCEETKKQLSEIESQLDRVINKRNLIDNKDIITCIDCGAILIEYTKRKSHICLPSSSIDIYHGKAKLKCNCGKETIVDMYKRIVL